MRLIIIFILLFTFISPFVLKAAEEIDLTLDEAIALALRDNREVLLKIEDVRKAKEKIAEAKAGFLPTLNFTGSLTDTHGYYARDLRQTTTQTTLKQYLYKGGKTINTLEQNQYKFRVSQALLDKTKQEIVLKVKKAFYTLCLAQGLTELNKGILDNTLAHLTTTQARYQKGEMSQSSVLEIKESLASVEEAYEESLNQIESSLSSLKNLLYLDEDVKIRPLAQFIYEPKEVAFDEAFLEAMKRRPEIRQYEAQMKADKKAIEVAKSDNRPDIYASWDYYSRSHTSATTSKNWNDYNIIGLTFSWPIFDGWLTKAKVQQAIVDLKTTQLTREKTLKDIALELKDAYLALKNAISKIKTQETQEARYEDNLSVIKDKYQKGIASLLDLDDANLSYNISRFNKNEAIYDYIIAKSNFDKATGGI